MQFFVGLDISKFKHDCAIIDGIGDVVTPSWSFNNDSEGFSLLKKLLSSLEGEIKIGLEATGHYGQNLKLFLESNGFTSLYYRSKPMKNKKIQYFTYSYRALYNKNAGK